MTSLWDPPPGKWAYMPSGRGEISALEVKEVLVEGRSEFQSYAIIDTVPFGLTLVLDGQIQSAQYDEWIYHEALVCPAMCALDAPRKVAVLGGGEGAMLREVLRHPTVESVVMVDIDGEVVEACREHLRPHHEGAFDDPRVTLFAEDARAWIEREQGRDFDVVLIDLTEPLAGGPSCRLFTKEFYELVRAAMSPEGVMALQAGPVRPGSAWAYGRVIKTLEDVFPGVIPYAAWITSFFEEWGFAVAGAEPLDALGAARIDDVIAKRAITPKYLDGKAFEGLRCLSRYIRKDIEEATEVIVDASPLGLHR